MAAEKSSVARQRQPKQVSTATNYTQQLNTMIEYTVNMITRLKCIISKNSQVLNRIGTGYRALTKILVVHLLEKDMTLVLLTLSLI
jgi:hypothetical protein